MRDPTGMKMRVALLLVLCATTVKCQYPYERETRSDNELGQWMSQLLSESIMGFIFSAYFSSHVSVRARGAYLSMANFQLKTLKNRISRGF